MRVPKLLIGLFHWRYYSFHVILEVTITYSHTYYYILNILKNINIINNYFSTIFSLTVFTIPDISS